jgi:hypothetical protein
VLLIAGPPVLVGEIPAHPANGVPDLGMLLSLRKLHALSLARPGQSRQERQRAGRQSPGKKRALLRDYSGLAHGWFCITISCFHEPPAGRL